MAVDFQDCIDTGYLVRCPSTDSTIRSSQRHFCFPRHHVSPHSSSSVLQSLIAFYSSLALITLVLPFVFDLFYHSEFSHRHFRRFSADYGMPITIIAISGLAYWGRFSDYVHVEGMRLPTNAAFQPAGDRDWLVRFWNLPGKYVGIAFPFGFVLFVLFYFDANVSVSGLLIERILLISQRDTVIDRARIRIPPAETSRIPLGFLFARHHNLHCRPPRYSCPEWPDTTGAHAHRLPRRDGKGQERRGDNR